MRKNSTFLKNKIQNSVLILFILIQIYTFGPIFSSCTPIISTCTLILFSSYGLQEAKTCYSTATTQSRGYVFHLQGQNKSPI